jgi:hypothetical protein
MRTAATLGLVALRSRGHLGHETNFLSNLTNSLSSKFTATSKNH